MDTELKANKIVGWIKKGFLLYKKNFLNLFAATLLVQAFSGLAVSLFFALFLFVAATWRGQMLSCFLLLAVSWLTCLIFSVVGGPLAAGIASLRLGLLDGRRPKPGITEVFNGFYYFSKAFPFNAAWCVINAILYGLAFAMFSRLLWRVIMILVPVISGTLSMFGMYLIVDKGLSFRQAFLESIRLARKHFWVYALVFLIAAWLSTLGVLACGIGILLSIPISGCVTAVLYRDAMPAD